MRCERLMSHLCTTNKAKRSQRTLNRIVSYSVEIYSVRREIAQAMYNFEQLQVKMTTS